MRVKQGDPLGQVGNSGNSSQPHLHLHAERGGEPGEILVGEAVPITLGGRFLVRNRPLHRSLMRSTDRQPVQWDAQSRAGCVDPIQMRVPQEMANIEQAGVSPSNETSVVR
jgi:murein DD-endopeptidase MepM/ murein hydrolase activator NlpD